MLGKQHFRLLSATLFMVLALIATNLFATWKTSNQEVWKNSGEAFALRLKSAVLLNASQEQGARRQGISAGIGRGIDSTPSNVSNSKAVVLRGGAVFASVGAENIPSSEKAVGTTVSSAEQGSMPTQKSEAMGGENMPTTQPVNAAISIPAAFGDPSVLGELSESQKAQIGQIIREFNRSVITSDAPKSSPEYKRIWDTAAFVADEAFRGKFGVPAFNAMQISRGYQP